MNPRIETTQSTLDAKNTSLRAPSTLATTSDTKSQVSLDSDTQAKRQENLLKNIELNLKNNDYSSVMQDLKLAIINNPADSRIYKLTEKYLCEIKNKKQIFQDVSLYKSLVDLTVTLVRNKKPIALGFLEIVANYEDNTLLVKKLGYEILNNILITFNLLCRNKNLKLLSNEIEKLSYYNSFAKSLKDTAPCSWKDIEETIKFIGTFKSNPASNSVSKSKSNFEKFLIDLSSMIKEIYNDIGKEQLALDEKLKKRQERLERKEARLKKEAELKQAEFNKKVELFKRAREQKLTALKPRHEQVLDHKNNTIYDDKEAVIFNNIPAALLPYAELLIAFENQTKQPCYLVGNAAKALIQYNMGFIYTNIKEYEILTTLTLDSAQLHVSNSENFETYAQFLKITNPALNINSTDHRFTLMKNEKQTLFDASRLTIIPIPAYQTNITIYHNPTKPVSNQNTSNTDLKMQTIDAVRVSFKKVIQNNTIVMQAYVYDSRGLGLTNHIPLSSPSVFTPYGNVTFFNQPTPTTVLVTPIMNPTGYYLAPR